MMKERTISGWEVAEMGSVESFCSLYWPRVCNYLIRLFANRTCSCLSTVYRSDVHGLVTGCMYVYKPAKVGPS